ncbi:DNA helicase II/ATP-dependent DNA helicase PcrA [Kwoniella heveanensis CBS 569]|nr:DNA helicase II/ATP-dependent DNA helicase PcrA [Kwoniella heveanensis CBS 569]
MFRAVTAVTASPDTPLQILAGPGSGKTRVLTSRVAYLVQHHGFRPHEIVAVTFTNKASNEMKKRLQVLLGAKAADGLVLGTFHATCAKYLRRYGQLIDLPNNFVIADADDCKKVMSTLLKARKDVLDESRISLKEGAVLSEISKAKAKEESPDGMAIRAAQDPSSSTSTTAIIAELYMEYELALREANSLDFDDLLVFGLKLFRTAPRVLESCRHILVDEFQDTNTTQYELMKCFAQAHGGVSVVGDPDQSIYGWRSAEVENLNKMTSDFPGVEAIYLEENYRSTGSILSAAHAIVSQDRSRIQKNLYTSHPRSTPVTLKVFSTPVIEASFIATEIKRLIAYSGGVLKYDDFAILLRYNALSRVLESALQKDSIPNRIVGGHKFFERMEIKDLLAYLQLADNPGFTPAFIRVVNTPKRAIGDKSVADLLAAAKSMKISPMELSERIIDGEPLPSGIKSGIKKNLATFVGAVRKIRRAAEKGSSVADLIRLIVEKTGYEEYLRTSQPDFDSRWENVQELISYSVTVAEEQARLASGEPVEEGFLPASSAAIEAIVNRAQAEEKVKAQERLHPMFRRQSSSLSASSERSRSRSASKGIPKVAEGEDGVIEVLSSDDEAEAPAKAETGVQKEVKTEITSELVDELANAPENMTPLAFFLQTSMLSTDTESDQDDAYKPKVTITTVHAAKGLEWPVVFIPAVEQGTYPSYRCTEAHEIAEERRLLYVAMTRAQNFLFRMMGGEENDKEASEFVAMMQRHQPNLISTTLPDVDLAVRRYTCKMLERPPPDEDATKEMIRKHVRAAPPLSMWDAPEPRDKWSNRFARREVTKATRAAEYWASDADEYALPGAAGGGSASGSSNPYAASMANSSGFTSARMGLAAPKSRQPGPNSNRSEAPLKKEPVKIKSANKNIPELLPFTFGQPDPVRSEASIGSFTSGNSASLAMMATLGLPPDLPPGAGSANGRAQSNKGSSPFTGSSPRLGGGSSPAPGAGAGVAKPNGGGVRLPAVPGLVSTAARTGAGTGSGGTGVPGANGLVSRGTKRLGMGRPAPWGAKKAREG